ncbi:hypothetical protein VOLCADRAFT_102847, partial [Volvox carteri f. nagariensis]
LEWQHVTVISTDKKNKESKCNYCFVIVKGSATRIRAHLGHIEGQGISKCPNVPPKVRELFQKERLHAVGYTGNAVPWESDSDDSGVKED